MENLENDPIFDPSQIKSFDDFRKTQMYDGTIGLIAYGFSKLPEEVDDIIVDKIIGDIITRREDIISRRENELTSSDAIKSAFDIVDDVVELADKEDKYDFVVKAAEDIALGVLVERKWKIRIFAKMFAKILKMRRIKRRERKGKNHG